jgi:hypothetical protein
MNSPHVKALYYNVIYAKDIDYENCAPLFENKDEFEFSLNQKSAVFAMKKHCATIEEAKSIVEEYLRDWDILIGLEQDPNDLQLKFSHADIIDQAPSMCAQNEINLQTHCSISDHGHGSDTVLVHKSRVKYPSFPKDFHASLDVETMYLRYKSYRQGRETLTSMAYMCLTILDASSGGRENAKKQRENAGKQYNIEHKVLDTLGKLTAKGGPEDARKSPKNGIYNPLLPQELAWIESAIKAIIRRAGEYAYNPKSKLRQITLKDFPKI